MASCLGADELNTCSNLYNFKRFLIIKSGTARHGVRSLPLVTGAQEMPIWGVGEENKTHSAMTCLAVAVSQDMMCDSFLDTDT